MDLRTIARLLLFPWRFAWATANHLGLFNFSVGSAPHLDEVALRKWREVIAKSQVYLEYGSGGSTIEAANTVAQVVSVETDSHFLHAVERALKDSPHATAKFQPVHVDVGWTEKWGRPLIALRTPDRLDNWRRYTSAPWEFLEQTQTFPDFVFVDGRFRTASVLESLLRLPPESECLIMLDDFQDRQKRYGAVLEFVDDIEFVGRAITFRRKRNFDRDECAELLSHHQADPE